LYKQSKTCEEIGEPDAFVKSCKNKKLSKKPLWGKKLGTKYKNDNENFFKFISLKHLNTRKKIQVYFTLSSLAVLGFL
jgi:hypothetical protein